MLIPRQHPRLSQIAAAAVFLALAGCGSGSLPTKSGNFSGIAATQREEAAGTPAHVGVAKVTLGSSRLIGGDSIEITVNLTQPAPNGGAVVQLISSDASVVATPAAVTVPAGRTSATVPASTSSVDAAATLPSAHFTEIALRELRSLSRPS